MSGAVEPHRSSARASLVRSAVLYTPLFLALLAALGFLARELAIEPGGDHIRQTDFDFLTSQQAKNIVQEEGIILLDYRALQAIWKDK